MAERVDAKERIREKESMSLAMSYLNRAWNKKDEAEKHIRSYHYSESISASQEYIELSMKSIFLILEGASPKKHEFSEEEFETAMKRIPEKLESLSLPKVYLYSRFWSSFYTTAKYGLERLGVGADKLFEKEEVELALKHAKECYYVATSIKGYIENPY